ncbi:LacI family DNA-binding transcriptional regulator [Nonomuraea sp. NPDC049750]|uniref:LacI family DNA-binding transcriptional regulator n=2 Tax=unclassified Nonomuraea TaxID=2593643 RepID=UPI0033DDE922
MTSEHLTRRPTAADIARSLGISRATVGFVLNNTPGQTISEPTRARVLAEAKRLGYQPHSAARALASGRSHIILMILPDWPLDFALRRNIEEASLTLDEAGYTLVTYTSHPTGLARPLWETLQPDVVMSMTPISAEDVASIRAAGIVNLIPDPERANGTVYVDEGPRLQVEHLHSLGHRRIAFAGSTDPRIAELVAERREHSFSAAQHLGMEIAAEVQVDLFDQQASADLVLQWHASGITAVAAYNDDVAASLVGAALRSGLDVPKDVSVIGHDDTPLAGFFHPQLTTIRTDTAGLGRYSAALAISAATGTTPPTVGPEFSSEVVVRASTGPAGLSD